MILFYPPSLLNLTLIISQVKYMHELIMPAHEYGALKELTVSKDFEVVFALADVAGHDRVPLARALLSVFQEDGKEIVANGVWPVH